jgi:hypothetical protein
VPRRAIDGALAPNGDIAHRLRMEEAADWDGLEACEKQIDYSGSSSTTKARNGAYLSPIIRAAL